MSEFSGETFRHYFAEVEMVCTVKINYSTRGAIVFDNNVGNLSNVCSDYIYTSSYNAENISARFEALKCRANFVGLAISAKFSRQHRQTINTTRNWKAARE